MIPIIITASLVALAYFAASRFFAELHRLDEIVGDDYK